MRRRDPLAEILWNFVFIVEETLIVYDAKISSHMERVNRATVVTQTRVRSEEKKIFES
jgi:hypothetical protein